MPELPEVETVRRSLVPLVVGARVDDIMVRERRLRRRVRRGLEEQLRHRRIAGIRRRGKYLLFDLEPPACLLVHLGMSGALELRPHGLPLRLHDHVRIVLDVGVDLVFNDPRRFGLLRLGSDATFAELRNVGPDPLAESWSAERLRDITRRRRLPIKNLLMDQRAIGGIGNIYANEMLYRAGIRPRRRAATLRRRELEALAAAMRAVLEEAVRLGGSSISNFRDGSGRPGYFQLRLAVYRREGQPCARCGTLIRRLVLSGRSSFFCPRCQR